MSITLPGSRSALIALTASLLASASGCSLLSDPGSGGAGWIELFNGRDLTDWTTRHEDRLGNKWAAVQAVALDPADGKRLAATAGQGALYNGPGGRTCDIITRQRFGDCQIHLEFMVPQGSNSGIYLMGEYEIQIFDSFNKSEVTFSDCGGIYARWIKETSEEGHAPKVNASKAPGEWQSFDIDFRAPRFDQAGKKVANARFVKVAHNGKTVHENVELNGPTRGGLTDRETDRGPILLQGDHGPVAFRNIRVKPLR